MNTIGKILTLTTFGESHGPAMGGVLDGMPAGVEINLDVLQRFVDRRRAGQDVGSTARHEQDRVEVLSGIWQGKTLGTPIGFIVRNTDARSADYEQIAQCYRPNHADYTWEKKYGLEAAVVPRLARPWRAWWPVASPFRPLNSWALTFGRLSFKSGIHHIQARHLVPPG